MDSSLQAVPVGPALAAKAEVETNAVINNVAAAVFSPAIFI